VRLAQHKQDLAEKWRKFDVVTLELPPLPWAVAVRREDKTAPWGQFVTAALADWHNSGMLAKLQEKWLGPTQLVR
jgi:ABC-type amino acid transport substrate-binding protein